MHVRGDIVRGLRGLGLRPGALVMVHSSMRAVGPILGGPDEMIEALLEAVGAAGTVMMYVDWEYGAQGYTRIDSETPLSPEVMEAWPIFHPKKARADRSYGILPEFLRTWPGARRSGNPGASVAAVGARADWITADHPLNYGYGPGSPLAKLVEAQGQVLLLGSPLENVTLLHFSEHMARLPKKRVIRFREKLLRGGRGEWVEIEEFDTGRPVVEDAPEDHFDQLVRAYLDGATVSNGRVGSAESYLLDAEPLHRFAVRWLEFQWGEGKKGAHGEVREYRIV
jgi:aminoglycoside 3-N-acetyltransferase